MREGSPALARAAEGLSHTFALPPSASIRLLFAPYRVCPLGAHVDHQDGVVTGMAIDQGVAFAFAPRADSRVRAASANFPGMIEFDLASIPTAVPGDWGNFPRGAAVALQHSGQAITRGLDLYLVGELPVGGLSSSAAVGVGYLLALEAANDVHVPPEENVRLARAIENEYVGLNSGVLDQSMILLSREGTLLELDCRTGARRYVGFGEHRETGDGQNTMPAIAIAYSGLSNALVGTGYNQRVAECREAARLLLEQAGLPAPNGSARLRDVPPDAFKTHAAALPEPLRRRAAHYFGEQARVADGARAWAAGDATRVGQLVAESGRSSIDNYECGAPELIALYEALLAAPGVYGARFSGAGFRGSCIALVDPGRAGDASDYVHEAYLRAHPQYAATFGFFRCSPGPAAHLLV
jgi:galactokinase